MGWLVVRGTKLSAVHFSASRDEAVKWFMEASRTRNMRDCKIMRIDAWLTDARTLGPQKKYVVN